MENERCKDCEHCEYYINTTKEQQTGISWTLFFVLVICSLLGALFYFSQKSTAPKINVNGREIKISEGSYADFLIDSGLCSPDDIQRLVDELLGQ